MPDPKPKRPAPFCIRLSAAERAQLERDAGEMALGAYVKSRLFGGSRPKPLQQFAARVLAILGSLGLLDFLEALRRDQRAGLIALTPQLEAWLGRILGGIGKLRAELLAALGSQSEQ